MYFPLGVLTYAAIAKAMPNIINNGIYQYSTRRSKKLENPIVSGGNCSLEPTLSKVSCITGIANNVPNTKSIIIPTNCIMFGSNMSFTL